MVELVLPIEPVPAYAAADEPDAAWIPARRGRAGAGRLAGGRGSDLVEGYPFAAGQALRYALAGLALLVIARGRLPRLQPRELAGLLALSATGLVLFNLFVIEGVRETDPATIGVIVGCVPVVLAFAGPLLERPAAERAGDRGRVVVAAGAAGVQWAGGGITRRRTAARARRARLRGRLLAARRPAPGAARGARGVGLRLPVRRPDARRLEPGRRRSSLPLPDAEQAAALVYLALGVTVFGFVVVVLGRRVARRRARRAVLGRAAGQRAAGGGLLGVAEITPERLLAVGVVAAGVTLGRALGARARARAAAGRLLTCPVCSSTPSTGSATRASASVPARRSSTSTPIACRTARRPPT